MIFFDLQRNDVVWQQTYPLTWTVARGELPKVFLCFSASSEPVLQIFETWLTHKARLIFKGKLRFIKIFNIKYLPLHGIGRVEFVHKASPLEVCQGSGCHKRSSPGWTSGPMSVVSKCCLKINGCTVTRTQARLQHSTGSLNGKVSTVKKN